MKALGNKILGSSFRKKNYKKLIKNVKEVAEDDKTLQSPVGYTRSFYGKYGISDANFNQESNLLQRKDEVLRIAAENYKMVQRLERVQSSIGRFQNSTPVSMRKFSERPRSSSAEEHHHTSRNFMIDGGMINFKVTPKKNQSKSRQRQLKKARSQALLE